jgi:signal peptidase II
MKRSYLITVLILAILLLDQALKVWVKLSFSLGDEVHLFGWPQLRLHFVENPGMAFGWTLLGGSSGKLTLSLFRLLAIAFLIWYIRQLLRARVPSFYLLGFGLILAGAMGNMIDCSVYGLLFSESAVGGPPAQLVNPRQGYAPFLMGKVVDMFFMPVTSGIYPAWLPGIGGRPYLFFRPVFNLADIAISAGVLTLLWVYLRSWGVLPQTADEKPSTERTGAVRQVDLTTTTTAAPRLPESAGKDRNAADSE